MMSGGRSGATGERLRIQEFLKSCVILEPYAMFPTLAAAPSRMKARKECDTQPLISRYLLL